MDIEPDELAGVVDMFGALTDEELRAALAELAFKQGAEYDPEQFTDDVADAIEGYHLVAVDAGAVGGEIAGPDDDSGDLTDDDSGDLTDDEAGAEVLVPGPVAFPELPENAEDLAHIMDITVRSVDREAAGRAAVERFRADVDAADTAERVSTLVDVSYELEAWASVDLSDARERLDEQSS